MWLIYVWDYYIYYICGYIFYVRIWFFRMKLLKWGDDFNFIVVFFVRRVLIFWMYYVWCFFFNVKVVFEWFWLRIGIYLEDDLFFVYFSDVIDFKVLIDDYKIEVYIYFILYLKILILILSK